MSYRLSREASCVLFEEALDMLTMPLVDEACEEDYAFLRFQARGVTALSQKRLPSSEFLEWHLRRATAILGAASDYEPRFLARMQLLEHELAPLLSSLPQVQELRLWFGSLDPLLTATNLEVAA